MRFFDAWNDYQNVSHLRIQESVPAGQTEQILSDSFATIHKFLEDIHESQIRENCYAQVYPQSPIGIKFLVRFPRMIPDF